VIDRPPQSFRAPAAPAAQALARYRLPENQAGRLADQRAPAWNLSDRHEIEPVIDRTSEPGRQLEDTEVDTMGLSERWGHWNIETVNPTCVV